MKLRPLTPEDRPRIDALLSHVSAFTGDERDVALELVDHAISRPETDDYRFLLATPGVSTDDPLLGYLCYGRTPMTCSTYDLYWVATSPDHARKGVARTLVHAMEREIARDGGGLVRVETGSREGHGAAVRFYDALGFIRSAVLEDFYAPGDDLLIFTRKVAPDGGATEALPGTDEALIDAAFGYRDYAAERDFYLACARRFGGRDVRRVLGWECAAARHLAAFADLGIASAGVDGSEKMIAHAREILAASRATRSLQGAASPRAAIDLACSPLSVAPPFAPFDLSFVPLSALHQLTTPSAMIAHLRSAASVLSPSGLHVIETTHPLDLTPTGVHHTEWTEVRPDAVVHARFRMHIDRAAPHGETSICATACTVPVTLEVVAEGRASPASRLRSLRREDTWLVPKLADYRAMLADVPELVLVATLGDFNPDVPADHPAAWRLILVLRKI